MEYFRKSPLKPEDIGGLFNQENVKDKSSHDLVDIIAKNRELLEEIENLETDQETKKLIIGRVFEHSTSDGLQLAERSNFTNKDYFDVIKNPKFYLKHKALAKQIIQEAKFSAQSEADKEAVAELEAIYKKYDEDLAAGNDQIFLKTEKIQDHKVKTLLNKVDNWYSQFLKAKNIAPVSAEIDPRSPGEILGEDALEQIQLALEKNYYPTDVMRLVVKYLAQTQEKSLTKQARDIFRSDKLLQEKYKFKGFDDYLENIKKGKESVRQIALENLRKILNPEEMHKLEFGDYLPEIIIQKIIDKYKIDDDKILKQFTEARYKPLSITFKIQTQEAEKKIIQEINAKGKQIIWDEKLNKFIVEAGDVEQKETKFLTEEKILNMRERLLEEGAGEGSVALGLAGLDSPQAWAMRERLLKEGADKDLVAQGLAGLDSPQAWAMRERLLKEGARKDYVALGLAGLDSPQAWAMRERLLEEGAYKGSVAIGLAGLDSPQAWAMRERLLEEGAYKGLVAQGLAGLDSPQAWAMRERLLEEGAGNGSVAQGLAGLDSPQAWQMRERLLKEGADKDYVAVGLAGLDSPQAWAMRERLLKEGADKGYVALGLAGYYITFVWQLKNKPTEQAVIEQKISRAAAQEFDENKLRIEINNYLSQSSLLAQERNLSLKQKLRKGISQSKSVAKILSEMVKHSPEAFINTMAAKKDKRQTAKKLAGKTFPSILWSRPDNNWRSWEGYSGFDFSSDSRKEEAEPEDYLSPRSLEMMLGGNPEGLSKEGKDKEVMRFREPINGLLVTGIYGRLSGNNWDSSYQFAVDKKVMEKAKETTITLPQVGKKSKLPKLLNTEIIPERVKGIKKGEEIPLAVDISPMREATVNDTKGCRELVYSVESDEVPSVMREISNEEYIRFKEKFIKENGSEAIQPIAELPEEIDLFLQQIKNKSPKEQVQAIEEFVRSISYYDEKNGEMINLKINKSLDERLAIMQARVDELKAKNPKDKEILQNKMYAGVCADFAVLAAAILRRAGFVSGVLAGFYAQGTSVKLSNAHGTAFVVWPNQKGGNEIFAVDGTPEGLEGISAPSLVEIEKIREEKIAEIKQEAMEKLDEIMEILASHDEESIKKLTNGELEKVLNTVLRYDVKQENLQAINTMLEVYWYSPIHKLDLTEVDDKIKILKFFESEINRIRESQAEPVIDPGSKLFETVEAFTQRFSRGEDIQKGLDIIDNIASLVGNRLKQSERKALAVITTYLRAKKIKGDGN